MLWVMGLPGSVYWLAHFLSCVCHSFLCSLVAIGFMLFAVFIKPPSGTVVEDFKQTVDYAPFLPIEKTSLSLLVATFGMFCVLFSLHAMILSCFIHSG